MGYLLDTGSLAEVLRSVPSRALVRRLTTVPSRDRWTSVISVSRDNLFVAARKTRNPKVMQDVIRLVAAVKVAPFDMLAAQSFAKFRATVADADTDDVMIAAIAVSNDFTSSRAAPLILRVIPTCASKLGHLNEGLRLPQVLVGRTFPRRTRGTAERLSAFRGSC